MISPILNDVVSGRAPELMTFTVEQYHQLTESGVLLEGSPVELIDGVIVRKDRRDAKGSIMNHGPQHASTLTQLFQHLDRGTDSAGCHVRCQLPVTLSSDTEPEPDLAIVSGKPPLFFNRHPGPSELLAVVEIAYSSRSYDQTTKQRLYAAANIAVYWIVNLSKNCVEIYEKPDPASAVYQSMTVVDANGVARMPCGDGNTLSVPLTDFLPPTTK